MMNLHLIEELEYRNGPVLWDAGEGVCCAAAQLGACRHSEEAAEAWYEELRAEEEAADPFARHAAQLRASAMPVDEATAERWAAEAEEPF
jgi:hypothetical protein